MYTFINGVKTLLVFLVSVALFFFFFLADITGRYSLDKLPERSLFETKIVVVAVLVDCFNSNV